MRIRNDTRRIKLSKKTPRIIIKQAGARGGKGPKGDPGKGLPPGGTDGQVLYKNSDESYDTEWRTPTYSDKNYVQNFTTSSTVSVNHNLNKYPSVTVIDSAGDEVQGEVIHTNMFQLTVKFNAPFSGRITCN
jgi:hypothetical protein